jgi:hypothetical protein
VAVASAARCKAVFRLLCSVNAFVWRTGHIDFVWPRQRQVGHCVCASTGHAQAEPSSASTLTQCAVSSWRAGPRNLLMFRQCVQTGVSPRASALWRSAPAFLFPPRRFLETTVNIAIACWCGFVWFLGEVGFGYIICSIL